MHPDFIFIPAILMVLLTASAWLYLFIIRIPAISSAGIDLKKIRTRQLDSLLSEKAQSASQHLLNLFEIPLLFYILIVFLYISETVNDIFIYCACAFVFFRALHTLIHLTYNDVMQRFSVYILSSLILWFMWANFAFIIFKRIF